MKVKYTKYVIAKVEYDSEETWKETEKDIQDMIEMLTSIKRKATIVEVTQGVDRSVNDG